MYPNYNYLEILFFSCYRTKKNTEKDMNLNEEKTNSGRIAAICVSIIVVVSVIVLIIRYRGKSKLYRFTTKF